MQQQERAAAAVHFFYVPIDLYLLPRKDFKLFTCLVPEIFTNLFAEDTWKKIIILLDFLEHQKAANAFLVKKTHIFHPAKIFKYSLARLRNYCGLKLN
jgi:hypothetical protein